MEKFEIDKKDLQINNNKELKKAKKEAEVVSEHELIEKIIKLAEKNNDEELLKSIKIERSKLAKSGYFYKPQENLEIKNEKEMEEAKREAGVNSYFHSLLKSEKLAEKTGDKKLKETIIEKKKEFLKKELSPYLSKFYNEISGGCWSCKRLKEEYNVSLIIDKFLDLLPIKDSNSIDFIKDKCDYFCKKSKREMAVFNRGMEPYFCAKPDAEALIKWLKEVIKEEDIKKVENDFKMTIKNIREE